MGRERGNTQEKNIEGVDEEAGAEWRKDRRLIEIQR